jgi:diacylglycerol kinase (ATP)
MKLIHSLIRKFNYAVTGIIRVLTEELNMKIHFLLAVLVLLTSLLFDVSKLELLILFLTITLVIFAEMTNTAVERISDLISSRYHPQIKAIKDITAGAVLITALNAAVVGYIIFYNNLSPLTLSLLDKIRRVPVHLTFISLVLVMILVIAVKAYFKTGNFLQGGMPSGHTALAFCLAIIVAVLVNDPLIATLVLILALLVAESRIEGNIHSVLEVIWGGVVGLLVGLLIFQLFHV